ncbi:hypothetical protein CDC46_27660, partial (plasmid) [Ralstonia solanacearum]|uniref:hypothetical protein n=1 Tax=Ralstonia solanacearum TaxID=305 RepID=UPI001B3B4606
MFDFHSPNISPFLSSLPFEPSASSRARFAPWLFSRVANSPRSESMAEFDRTAHLQDLFFC